MLTLARGIAAASASVVAVALAGTLGYVVVSGEEGAGPHRAAALTVRQLAPVGAILPGQPPRPLSGTFDNPYDVPVRVHHVTVTISRVVKAPAAAGGSCDPRDFVLLHPVMSVEANVPPGRSVGSWRGASIQLLARGGVHQGACQGATVRLRYDVG